VWYTSLTRRGLADLLRGDHTVFPNGVQDRLPDNAISALDRDGVTVLWRDKPVTAGVIPSAVIVNEDRQRDFLAWMSTYVPEFRPITSVFRVMTYEVASVYLLSTEPLKSEFWLDACIGLVFAEALSYTGSRSTIQSISLAAFEWTCSFSIARGVAANVNFELLNGIPDLWYRMRESTRQPELPLSHSDIKIVWSVLLALLDGATPLTYAKQLDNHELKIILSICVEVAAGRDISAELSESLFVGTFQRDLFGLPAGQTREEKVRLFEVILADTLIKIDGRRTWLTGFALAYLASLIGVGSMEYYALLLPALAMYPTTLMWYGLLSGLAPKSTMQSVGRGLGRRIARDILNCEEFGGRPQSDVNATELELLLRLERVPEIRTSTPGRLQVEMLPCVASYIRWPARVEGHQTDLFSTNADIVDIADIRATTLELNSTLAHLEEVRSRLSKLLDLPSETRAKNSRRRRPLE